MMQTISVKTGHPYDIHIGEGLLDRAGEFLDPLFSRGKIGIIGDSRTFPLFGERLTKALSGGDRELFSYTFPAGEGSKNLSVWGEILEFLAARRFSRSDLLIALGGGVTGDLTGFSAASYLRGIRFVQIPTSLLAMVDSSVGGKTGVDLKAGKNLAGAFHQPSLVLCDPALLETLPPLCIADGAAEAVKAAVLADPDLFQILADGNWFSRRSEVITRCIQIKCDVVEKDEFDRGERQKLNLGHTIGHAIEQCTGYRISHGHAVAMGMAAITRAAVRQGIASQETLTVLEAALRNNRLPTELPLSLSTLLPVIQGDKKISEGRLTLIVPEAIGHCRMLPLSMADAAAFLSLGEKA